MQLQCEKTRNEMAKYNAVNLRNNMMLLKPGRTAAQFVVQMFDGHYFGELALIYGEPRNASVRASGEVIIILCLFDTQKYRVLHDKAFSLKRGQ